ncbi:hypothetical protein ACJX0J_034885, partial [Zea mays]
HAMACATLSTPVQKASEHGLLVQFLLGTRVGGEFPWIARVLSQGTQQSDLHQVLQEEPFQCETTQRDHRSP